MPCFTSAMAIIMLNQRSSESHFNWSDHEAALPNQYCRTFHVNRFGYLRHIKKQNRQWIVKVFCRTVNS